WATGSFLFYSYGSQGFDWQHPRIIDGLLSGRNGWLMYSPVMFLALAGMFCHRKLKPWFWCLLVLVPIYCYIIYSWYCWNYINGLGSRPMVHLYALLALPVAAFMAYITRQRLWIRAGVTLLSL